MVSIFKELRSALHIDDGGEVDGACPGTKLPLKQTFIKNSAKVRKTIQLTADLPGPGSPHSGTRHGASPGPFL